MENTERIELLSELVSCNHPLHSWIYDATCRLLHSNCPNEAIIQTVFENSGIAAYMLAYAQDNDTPVILSSQYGLMWIATFEKKQGVLHKLHVLGPCFTTEVSFVALETYLQRMYYGAISATWKAEFIEVMRSLPVIPYNLFCHYALMLHYCVTGEKLGISDLHFQRDTDTEMVENIQNPRDRHRTWMAEKALLRMVREGDSNYKGALNNASTISSGVPVNVGDPLRQAKNSCIVFTSLCVREAIEGGLSPEQAYSLGDAYIQSIEDAKTVSESASINHEMYDDFIKRVQKSRKNPNISKQIQSCCDYIELHLEEKLNIQTLADRLGYTKYYLSRRFKDEMNCSVNEYINYARVERAKLLLTTTNTSIQVITDQLMFCSRSYFTDTFKRVTGISPAEYRRETQKY